MIIRYLDLKEKRSTAKFVEVVKRRHNRLDILVNNAAVYHKPPVRLTCKAVFTEPLYISTFLVVGLGS